MILKERRNLSRKTEKSLLDFCGGTKLNGLPDLCLRDIALVITQKRQWQYTLVLLPGKSHGWRSLVGRSPWGLEELDTIESTFTLVITVVPDHCLLCFPRSDTYQAENHGCNE